MPEFWSEPKPVQIDDQRECSIADRNYFCSVAFFSTSAFQAFSSFNID